jgi:ABC-2 type transport system ATP-binding protein
MLAGLARPDSGEIRLDGLPLHENAVEAKRRIGYIPDMPFLYDRLTPAEFMRFVGDLYDLPEARVREATRSFFELFGLNDVADALIGDLSHGMRQRVIYAATFLHDPKVLFVDEPLVGLDPYTIRLIKDLFRAKTAAGMTIFLSTHILVVAEEIADRIGIIHKGKLIALGRMDELVAQAGSEQSLEDIFLKLTAEAAEEMG